MLTYFFRRQMTEARRQMTEARRQMTEARSQMTRGEERKMDNESLDGDEFTVIKFQIHLT